MIYNLFYFSGTGNTKYLYEVIHQALIDSADSITLESMVDTDSPVFQDSGARTLFIGYPIYGFGAPRLVESFIDRLPEGKGHKVVLAITAGDHVSINHYALFQIRKKLIQKDYDVIYERIFMMGTNFLIPYSDEVNALLCLALEEKVAHMMNDLDQCVTRRVAPSIFNRTTVSFVHYGESHFGGPLYGRSLNAGKSCNLCGWCIRHCPTKNIRLINEKIKFGAKCDLCMKCAYGCPKGAIKSRGFQFVILKNGYSIDKTLELSRTMRDLYLFDKSQVLSRIKMSKHIRSYIENVKE